MRHALPRPTPGSLRSGHAGPTRRAVLTAVLLACGAASVEAQTHEHPVEPWIEDTVVGMANALTGGVTAAVGAWLAGEDIGRAFVGGILGGAVVFAGKRIVVEDFAAAGVLGRQVGAVGSSLVRNASLGGPWLGEVWLPIGPLWVQAAPASPKRLRLNVWSAAVLGWAATRSELGIDWKSSAWSGTFVFHTRGYALRDDGSLISGFASGGLVVLGPAYGDLMRHTRGHELVHVVQQDFTQQAWGRPLESWGWSFVDFEPPVDLGIVMPLLLPAFFGDLHEAEAETLEAR